MFNRRTFLAGSAAATVLPSATIPVAAQTSVRKIALEEHFITPDFVDYWRKSVPFIPPAALEKIQGVLMDLGDQRLEVMDKAGIDKVVLSLAGTPQRETDIPLAIARAKLGNDYLAKAVSNRPNRYAGFASLPLQDPKAAADEIERCVKELGFKGAMIFGHTHGKYLDDRSYDVFWERVDALRAPIYLHAGAPHDRPHALEGRPDLSGPTWSWTVEAASHALRLVFSGLFERHPNIKLILGHMGETIPFLLWRFDSRWSFSKQLSQIPQPPSHYIRKNIAVTTAGVFSAEPLECAIKALGAENVMFSVDYPFEVTEEARSFMDSVSLTPQLREQVASGNARRILGLT